ncbi:peptidase dimerization domain-containing protein [Verrucomicrobium spinosum]|uniref:peptidase dimerization domain-containing protein n=1 Tax=Verrucomicrobium spinosum TaxID=2736 RepID=UPI000B101660|nr:peptidase dimerization domain-containing protein [Verrucomicrobium spinosum]
MGVITGGTQVNFVPDQCAIEIDRRLLPGERVEEVLAVYETLLGELRQQYPGLDVFMEAPMLTDEAWRRRKARMWCRSHPACWRNWG